MRRTYVAAFAVCGALLFAMIAGGVYTARAQNDAAPDAQTEAALQDLGAVYGSPVVRTDQAKAICNQEQYFVECAEIGKKHGLFDEERTKEVDAVLSQLKGKVVDDIKQCGSVECLVDVATGIAKKLSASHPAAAKSVGLTPQKVTEKRAIVLAAKTVGVDFDDCRTMDPDTAPVELLRGCAKLAKSESIQKYIPEEVKRRAKRADPAIALKESLARGDIQCGDGTLNGCGNFCLNPSAEARREGVSSIPGVCTLIAEKFFGPDGVEELTSAYGSVQNVYASRAGQAEALLFAAPDGRRFADPAAIGRYMEEAGQSGDVESVKRGMDFLVRNRLVTEKDREFAVSMVQKISDRGAAGFDFDRCRANPESCADFVPEEHREEFGAINKIEKVMRTEMEKLGITDPSRCESDPALRESCLAAAKQALPQMETLAGASPEAGFVISDIKRKIRFGEENIEARKRIEKSFESGAFRLGDRAFRAMGEVEEFCAREPETCLAETARAGFISRDVASEKFERAVISQYGPPSPYQPPYPYSGTSETARGTAYPPPPGSYYSPVPAFDKTEALKQFERWLDNPQGPPPQSVGGPAYAPYAPYPPYPPYNPYPRASYQQEEPYYYGSTTASRYACPHTPPPPPCRPGEYRQESANESGCRTWGACIPISTKTEPPSTDPKARQICPALPTVESCPAGQEKMISFTSPECGTYYSCVPVTSADAGITFPHTFANGKIAVSLDDAKGYCRQYGPGSGQGIAAECESKFGIVYDTAPINPPQREDGRSFRNGLYFTASFMSCMERLGNRDSAVKIQNWLIGGVVPPPWGELVPKGQTDVAVCERENTTPAVIQTPPGTTQTDCSRFGSGWHSMDSSGNCFNPNMTEYRTPAGTLNACGTAAVYGCSGSSSAYNTYQAPSGQKEQIWNTLLLRSWVRTDADGARIESLKGACANVRPQSNVWKPDAGNSGSVDFGMPDPAKCALAVSCKPEENFDGARCITSSYQTNPGSCSSGQYWNGTGCVATSPSDTPPSCPSGQYWNGTSCVPSTQTGTPPAVSGACSSELIGLLDSGCHNMGNAWFNGGMSRYVLPGTTTVRDCGIESISGCSGSPSSYTAPVAYSGCAAGQYWNGTGCVATSPSDTPPSCPSGQYWNGTSCVASSPPPPPPQPTCASDQYWDGTACVASPPPISYFCPQDHGWNGSYCIFAGRPQTEQNLASIISAIRSFLDW